MSRAGGQIQGCSLHYYKPRRRESNPQMRHPVEFPYHQVRLPSAIGYVTLADKLAGLEAVILAERDRELQEARARRKSSRHVA